MPQVTDKVAVGFDDYERRIGPQTPQDLGGKRSNSGSILHHHTGTAPVHLAEEAVDQKA